MPWPDAEVAVDEDLARRLLQQQHPDLAGLRIQVVDAGFDNVIMRLGPDLALRLPRREPAAALIEHEQRWMPHLPPGLHLTTPAPQRLGRPGEGYPWHWSVVPWIEGEPADRHPPEDHERTASDLGRFLNALHQPAPEGLPINPYRSGPLISREETFHQRRQALKGHIDDRRAQELWGAAQRATAYEGQPRWLHGDLHPANLLTNDGRVTAVIDFGDTCAGDPACDLGAIYLTVKPPDRELLHEAYGRADEATERRATGWTLLFALMLLEIGLTQRPTYAEVARRALTEMGVIPSCSD